MDMFGGLTKTSSRIAIAAALGTTLGGFAMSSTPVKAADLGGDCCADLEERVAELEATTVRKGNKKVSVTVSGWVVKLGEWWDDGSEQNFYVGDKHTTLSSHVQVSGTATIAPGWSGGYTLSLEMRGGSAVGDDNQFNDNVANSVTIDILSNQSVLLSYMWLKSDRWGTVNWGQLSQATDNVALLPDLSGTIIESNAVLFDGQGMFLRAHGAKGADGLATSVANGATWGASVTCISGGGGIGADCNGYPQNGVRYDSPTWGGFSVSGGFYEDDVKDIAVKYAADWWSNWKVSAAFGFSNVTDEGEPFAGTGAAAAPGSLVLLGGGGIPFQGFRRDVDVFQVGASVLHVPTGLFAYGLWQEEDNHGTTLGTSTTFLGNVVNSHAMNDNTVWFLKAGIKRTWTPLGATAVWGEYGRYEDQYRGLCTFGGNPGCFTTFQVGPSSSVNSFVFGNITSSRDTRYGVGVVQEIDSAAMHLFARWQHMNLDIDGQFVNLGTGLAAHAPAFENQNLYEVGGVIFF
jgi:predicted porin